MHCVCNQTPRFIPSWPFLPFPYLTRYGADESETLQNELARVNLDFENLQTVSGQSIKDVAADRAREQLERERAWKGEKDALGEFAHTVY
jgi:hypothetical protein